MRDIRSAKELANSFFIGTYITVLLVDLTIDSASRIAPLLVQIVRRADKAARRDLKKRNSNQAGWSNEASGIMGRYCCTSWS